MFPAKELVTADGESVEVIDCGLMNSNAGPDFFNAKIKIGGTMWVGNVEIHDKADDWYAHRHDKDAAYDNVILHVVGCEGRDTLTSGGRKVPQLRLGAAQKVIDNYRLLQETEHYPPCHTLIPSLDRLTVNSWLNALQAERLERKTRDIEARVERCGGSWEDALFVTMARNYGFGVNSDAFELWAHNIPLQYAARHRDDLLQTEALFMGQAGLLNPETIPERYRADAEREGYFKRLADEYSFLANKFSLKALNADMWRFLRMRPQNFPHIRISQLANLYHSRRNDLSRLAECNDAEQAKRLFTTRVSPYWETHYTFGSTSCKTAKSVSPSSLNLLVINTAVPMLFAYGRHRRNEAMCERAVDILSQLKAENNHITRAWRECGLTAANAGDSQALIQLKNEYCDRRDCLRCRIGYKFLKGSASPDTQQ